VYYSTNQEIQSVRSNTKTCVAREDTNIAINLLPRHFKNGSRGLEGCVSKPQIPIQVDSFVSSCKTISSCRSTTQNTPRTTSIDDTLTSQ
jgi:hypothetical protein